MGGMKNVLDADHIAVNNYSLTILNLITVTATEISGLEEELEISELPDRTKASSGNTKPTEFTAKIPMHHTSDLDKLEGWFAISQDPVSTGYKYGATLTHKSISGERLIEFSLLGMFPTKRTLPDLEMSNEGDMATVEWTFSVDSIVPLFVTTE